MEQFYEQIRAYIDAHRQEMLDLWRDMVNTESGPAQKEGADAVHALLAKEMTACGLSVQDRKSVV